MAQAKSDWSPSQKECLNALGVPIWVSRSGAPTCETSRADDGVLTRCAEQVASCTACALSQGRTQTVFGVGNSSASLMLVGEAPGEQEDRQGIPFVGRGGQLLTSMVQAIGLRRDDIYIANTVKCRPPGNRNPAPDEVQACSGFLKTQIETIQPKLMVAVGLVASQALLQTDRTMGQLRGQLWRYAPLNIPLMVTYHPAYLLRSPREKRRAYDDWLRIKAFLAEA